MKLIFLFCLFTIPAFAEDLIKVAVLDTGFGYNGLGASAKLCKYGHKDFTLDRDYTFQFGTIDAVPVDSHGHGTNLVGIINTYGKASGKNFCVIVMKIYPKTPDTEDASINTANAVAYANHLKVDIINYSGGGKEENRLETKQVKKFLDRGGTFVAAAGNEGKELGKINTYYPAMADTRTIIVGNKNYEGKPSRISNYGKIVNRWEFGEEIQGFGIVMTGTSQATAVATGKIISEIKKKYDSNKKIVDLRK